MTAPADPRPPTPEVDERAPLLGDQHGQGISGSSNNDPDPQDAEQPWHASTRRLTWLERFLILALLLFLCLAATFIGLFAGEKNAAKHRPLPEPITETSTVTDTRTQTLAPAPTPEPPRNEEVCLTPNCVATAASLLEGMDTTVDPCEDFYGFVNNGWLGAHPIPQDKALFGSSQAISLENKRIVRKYLTQDAHQLGLPKEDHANLLHLQSVYASCMDIRQLDHVGSQPVQNIVNHIHHLWQTDQSPSTRGIFDPPLPPIATDLPQPAKPDVTLSPRLTRVLAFLHSRAVPVLFTTFLNPDPRVDPETQLLALQQAELSLPDPSYYKDKTLVDQLQGIVERTLEALEKDFPLTTSKKNKARHPLTKQANAVVELEKKLARVMVSPLDLDDPQKIYNRYALESVEKLAGGLINFRDYFASFSPRPALPDPVIVTGPSYFKDIVDIVRKTDPDTLEAYFVWKTAQSLGPLLSPQQKIWRETRALSALITGVDPEVQDRQDFCVQHLEDTMGLLSGHFYVRDTFPSTKKQQAQDIIESVIQGFIRRLPDMAWLDEATRKHAEKKAKAIRVKVGFPSSPDTLNPVALERYYALQAPFDSTDFVGNALRARVAEQRRKWNKIGSSVDHGEWEMVPTESNAYYIEANELAIPAGEIRPPYYSDDAPEYVNFGGLGSLAGHELTHAFDKTGRRFDADGRLFDWWSNQTDAAFDARQQCIIDQYSGYTVLDPSGKTLHVHSEFTAGEDVADAGGLTAAFDAWQTRFESDRAGKNFDNRLLPGVSFTREQLFFISYARGWARSMRPAEAAQRIFTDPHSPAHFRVLGPLSNDDNFAAVFQCKKGSRYNPEKTKCKVW